MTVTATAELVRVLRMARGGETILLAPGQYGDLALSGVRPASQVTIRSADPDNDAMFDSVKLTRVANLVFEDVDIRHVLGPKEADHAAGVMVNNSNDVSFVGIDFAGSINGSPFDDGNGLVVTNSSRVTILDSTFREFNNAAMFSRSNDVIFAGNSIRDAREGVNITQIDGGLFERNYITGIRPDVSKRDHSDAFQVHAGGANGISRDLAFNANVIMGDENQGIFIRSEKAQSLGLVHNNIVITNNYVESNLRNAISVADVDGVIVSGNSIRDADSTGLVPGLTISNLSDGVISRNVVPLFDVRAQPALANVNLTIADNIDIWESTQRRGIAEANLFAAPAGTGDIDFSALGVRSGSTAAVLGAGFQAVAGIGNLAGSAGTQLAMYLPQLEGQFTAAYPL
ncbi:MAG: right-handed parallel beta-helix repeat-containing protein [Polymorphobacter sp.]